MEKKSVKNKSSKREMVTILTAIISCVGTVLAAIVISPIVHDMFFPPAPMVNSATTVVEPQASLTETASIPTDDLNTNVSTPPFSLSTTQTPISPTMMPENPPASISIDIASPPNRFTDSTPFFLTRFWLDEIPPVGYFLYMETSDVEYANPVSINDVVVGVVPTDRTSPLFVPSSTLFQGENTLSIAANEVKDGEVHDEFVVHSIEIRSKPHVFPTDDLLYVITIDDATHHIGDSTNSKWSQPDPESTSYVKFFQLKDEPQGNALLILDTFQVQGLLTVRVNDSVIGYLPGQMQDVWANDATMFIPSTYLYEGTNSIRIDTVWLGDNDYSYISDSFDDFMIRNLRLQVYKK